jgi:hypothetical protein
MSVAKDVAGIIPGLQSVALLGYNVKMLSGPKARNNKMGRPRNFSMNAPSAKKMMKLGVTNLVGVSLIGATAGAVNAIK